MQYAGAFHLGTNKSFGWGEGVEFKGECEKAAVQVCPACLFTAAVLQYTTGLMGKKSAPHIELMMHGALQGRQRRMSRQAIEVGRIF